MVDSSFYKNSGPFKISSIIKDIDCEFVGDRDFVVENIAPLESAKPSELTFFNNKKYLKIFNSSNAGVIIVEKKYAIGCKKNYIISQNPYYTFALIANKFYENLSKFENYYSEEEAMTDFDDTIKISKNSFIHKSVKLGKNIIIGLNSVIGPNVNIGNNCNIADNVSIFFANLDENVKVASGTKIGSEGFGFATDGDKIQKIPQIGRVIIMKNVEIGSNCCIDRGSAGDTVIGNNCMVDNLVHIAHNVEIGKNCIIAGQVGIAGSTKIGKNVSIGGQVGVNGHIKIGNNVKIAAKSGVISDINDNVTMGGYPSVPIKDWHRNTIFLKKSIKKNEK